MKISRKQLRKMVLNEQARDYPTVNSDINKELAIEMLKNVINDLQNVPRENFDRYIQHLISYQIPNIIRTLGS